MSDKLNSAALFYAAAVKASQPPKDKLKQFDDKLFGFGGHKPTFYFGTVEVIMTPSILKEARGQLLEAISAAEVEVEKAATALVQAAKVV